MDKETELLLDRIEQQYKEIENLKAARERAKKEGLCIRCFKKPAMENVKVIKDVCFECREELIKFVMEWNNAYIKDQSEATPKA